MQMPKQLEPSSDHTSSQENKTSSATGRNLCTGKKKQTKLNSVYVLKRKEGMCILQDTKKNPAFVVKITDLTTTT